jgi:hypothetical protein
MQRLLLLSSLFAVVAVIPSSFATPARAQTFELEAAYEAYGAAFRAGVALGDRLVVQAGAGFTTARASYDAPPGIGILGATESALALAVPLDVKIYLTEVRAGAVAPVVRVEARYEHTSFAQSTTNGAYVALLAGAQYMVTDILGILLEGGLDYGMAWTEPSYPSGFGGLGGLGDLTTQTETFRFRWRAGLVLRM